MKLKDNKIRIDIVAGARPNFMKCAPLIKEFAKHSCFDVTFIHTGQHYDYDMSTIFFRNLKLRRPEIFLGVGSAPRYKQIEMVRKKLRNIFYAHTPDFVIVVGDVNSTLGAAMAAKDTGVLLVHVEAGLRSFDMTMPEERNRIATDAISDILFTTSASAIKNLVREGVPRRKIYFVGNVMIDTLVNNLKFAGRSGVLKRLKLKKKEYYLLTVHRPSNVDNGRTLRGILRSVADISSGCKIVFPVHPRTRKALRKFGLTSYATNKNNFITVKPLGYLDFLKLMRYCKAVFTDSGGIQEEAAYLKIPCLTLRENTERPVTIKAGTNIIAGCRPSSIRNGFKLLTTRAVGHKTKDIRFWDGKTSKRIADVLMREAQVE